MNENSDPPPDYFPNKIGTAWKYKVYDHIQNLTDTITVSITGTTSLEGVSRPALVWTFNPCGRPEDSGLANNYDTLYVVGPNAGYSGATPDSIMIYSSADPPTPYLKLKLPFTAGMKWSCDVCHDLVDSTWVEEKLVVNTDAGSFVDVFRLYELYDRGTSWETGVYTSWVKPHVGIIKAARIEYDAQGHPEGPVLSATWELIEYHLAR